jgi:hypothetical protein
MEFITAAINFTSRMIVKKKKCGSSSNLASATCLVWIFMLVNNTFLPTGEMKEEIAPSVKSIALETQAAVLENLKFISASDRGGRCVF